jgi:hypothetical protein
MHVRIWLYMYSSTDYKKLSGFLHIITQKLSSSLSILVRRINHRSPGNVRFDTEDSSDRKIRMVESHHTIVNVLYVCSHYKVL